MLATGWHFLVYSGVAGDELSGEGLFDESTGVWNAFKGGSSSLLAVISLGGDVSVLFVVILSSGVLLVLCEGWK